MERKEFQKLHFLLFIALEGTLAGHELNPITAVLSVGNTQQSACAFVCYQEDSQ